jgi:hypothetical protein
VGYVLRLRKRMCRASGALIYTQDFFPALAHWANFWARLRRCASSGTAVSMRRYGVERCGSFDGPPGLSLRRAFGEGWRQTRRIKKRRNGRTL